MERKYIKKKLIALICPDCKREVKGTTPKQAKAMLKEHKKSFLHKAIVTALRKKQDVQR